jgi:hypothetical protein
VDVTAGRLLEEPSRSRRILRQAKWRVPFVPMLPPVAIEVTGVPAGRPFVGRMRRGRRARKVLGKAGPGAPSAGATGSVARRGLVLAAQVLARIDPALVLAAKGLAAGRVVVATARVVEPRLTVECPPLESNGVSNRAGGAGGVAQRVVRVLVLERPEVTPPAWTGSV